MMQNFFIFNMLCIITLHLNWNIPKTGWNWFTTSCFEFLFVGKNYFYIQKLLQININFLWTFSGFQYSRSGFQDVPFYHLSKYPLPPWTFPRSLHPWYPRRGADLGHVQIGAVLLVISPTIARETRRNIPPSPLGWQNFLIIQTPLLSFDISS